MKRWYSALDICFKTALVSTIALLAIMLATSWLFFIAWAEIPLGILLGAGVGILSYLLMGFINIKERNGRSAGFITSIIVRFVLIAAATFVAAWLYYKLDLHLFNVFGVVGGYFIPVIALCVLMGKEGKRNVR